MYERYCKLRDNLGVKDADVAKATGITPSTFSDWKKGKSAPNADKQRKIAEYFGVPVEYIITGKELTAIDWFEQGLSLIGWREDLAARDSKEYETTLTNGEERVRVSTGDLQHMVDGLLLDLLGRVRGERGARANDASRAQTTDEQALLDGFRAASQERREDMLNMASRALLKSTGSMEMSGLSTSKETA